MSIERIIGRLVDIQSGILDGIGAAFVSEQSRRFASGEAGHPVAIGMSLRQAPCTVHTHTHRSAFSNRIL